MYVAYSSLTFSHSLMLKGMGGSIGSTPACGLRYPKSKEARTSKILVQSLKIDPEGTCGPIWLKIASIF